MRKASLLLTALICSVFVHAQQEPLKWLDEGTNTLNRLAAKIQKTNENYLDKLERRELKIVSKVDSAKRQDIKKRYDACRKKLAAATGRPSEYYPQLDTLESALHFLRQTPALNKINELNKRLVQTELLATFIQNRKNYLQSLLQQYPLTKDLLRYKETAYYYQCQVAEYKSIIHQPGKLLKSAFNLLRQQPAFSDFMKKFGYLTALFNIPGDYTILPANLQTRSAVLASIVQSQGNSSSLQSILSNNIQAAKNELNKLKEKLNSDVPDMPDGYKTNNQKIKRFLDRLEYGTNFQTTRGNYFFPNTSDVGLSIGYKLNDKSVIGIGGSYKVGIGRDWNHIHITSQGASLRTFIDWMLKARFLITGGYEYNYQVTPDSLPVKLSGWTSSGLIGLTKRISIPKGKLLKGSNLQLLWDFLSYYQSPRTTAFKFRIGYNF